MSSNYASVFNVSDPENPVNVDGELEIRTVHIVCEDAEFAYIREGLSSGDQVVVTSLATAAPGTGLKRIGDETDDTEASTP